MSSGQLREPTAAPGSLKVLGIAKVCCEQPWEPTDQTGSVEVLKSFAAGGERRGEVITDARYCKPKERLFNPCHSQVHSISNHCNCKPERKNDVSFHTLKT